MKYRRVEIVEDANIRNAVKFFGIAKVARTASVDRGELSHAVNYHRPVSESHYEKVKKAIHLLEQELKPTPNIIKKGKSDG